ncbi:unnamed protein product [Brachionus calyciflorus]|uniref:Prokaryotic-type class I peptide chain release factors domain-containing protein n=1 Tax=Brachionus calyciflorus TaxID=104777 RepID=A0A814LA66_9BILA|nr:unnamed protein product [Brachionus calyciflorus]
MPIKCIKINVFQPIEHFSPEHRRFLKEPTFPPLNEEEIREIYAKGSGPGGQKLNKATNRCQLKHLPTGIIVTSHHTRSLEENRKIARKLLQQKLDLLNNKESSYLTQLAKLKQEEKLVRTKRSIENLKRKKQFKQEEELE